MPVRPAREVQVGPPAIASHSAPPRISGHNAVRGGGAGCNAEPRGAGLVQVVGTGAPPLVAARGVPAGAKGRGESSCPAPSRRGMGAVAGTWFAQRARTGCALRRQPLSYTFRYTYMTIVEHS